MRTTLRASLAAVLLALVAAAAGPQAKDPEERLRVLGLIGFSVENGVRSCALMPDGKRLLLGENHFRLAMFDISRMLQQKQFQEVWARADWNGESPSDLFVATDKDGHNVASATVAPKRSLGGGLVEVRDPGRGDERFSGKQAGGVWAVRFSPDGNTLATAGDDKQIILWDWKKRAVKSRLAGHTGAIYALAFSPDGHMLASGGQDKTVKLWNVEAATEIKTLGGHTGGVGCLAFSPDGHSLVSGGFGAEMKIWDVEAGTSKDMSLAPFGPIYGISWSPDGRLIATAGKYSGAKDNKTAIMVLWDVKTGFPASITGGSGSSANCSMTGSYFDVSFSRDGHAVAGVGQEGNGKGRIDVWYLGNWEKGR